jgi:hypothetical protein
MVQGSEPILVGQSDIGAFRKEGPYRLNAEVGPVLLGLDQVLRHVPLKPAHPILSTVDAEVRWSRSLIKGAGPHLIFP